MLRWFWAALVLVLVMGGTLSAAQDATAAPESPTLTYGATVSGRLDNRTPLVQYSFDGLRGEYVALRLRTLGGTLDPVLTVLDESGTPLLIRDDSDGVTDAIVRQVRLPVNARYTVVVGRFGYALGSTSGEYSLSIERIGVSPESGSSLRYGDTVANAITDATPQVFYSFRAQRGDIITLTMRRDSGTLDPLLKIVNVARQIIAQDDDSLNAHDARIDRFTIQEDGQYLIIATRYGGEAGQTTGNFLLTLQRADSSGLGASPEVSIPLMAGIPDQRELTAERWQQYYVFSARRDDIITLRLDRVNGSLDPFIELLDANLQPLISHDDIEEGVQRNSLIEDYRIPADGTYYVIATRFERQAGTTLGAYRLTLELQGSAFAAVPSDVAIVDYGQTTVSFVDDLQGERLYAFYGQQGDVVRISANRTEGDILPVVTLLNEARSPLIESALGTANALINDYQLPNTGTYYVRVTRQNGVGAGGFVLLVNAQ